MKTRTSRNSALSSPANGARLASALFQVLVAACLVGSAFGQQTQGPVIVGAPVTPIKVTVKPAPASQTASAAAPDVVTVTEGEPLPTVTPPPRQPIVDPVFQWPLPKALQKRGALGFGEAVSGPIVNVLGMLSGPNPPGSQRPHHLILSPPLVSPRPPYSPAPVRVLTFHGAAGANAIS